MAFFRTVSLSDLMPAVSGEGVVLRAPQMSDHAEWAALREASRDFLTPWEPAWPADDLARSSFRRRIKRYSEDQRGDLAYACQGHMTAAVTAIIPFAFGTLKLHRIEAACIPANVASVRLLERTGFQREGFARQYLCIDGAWQDHLLYARIKDDPSP